LAEPHRCRYRVCWNRWTDRPLLRHRPQPPPAQSDPAPAAPRRRRSRRSLVQMLRRPPLLLLGGLTARSIGGGGGDPSAEGEGERDRRHERGTPRRGVPRASALLEQPLDHHRRDAPSADRRDAHGPWPPVRHRPARPPVRGRLSRSDRPDRSGVDSDAARVAGPIAARWGRSVRRHAVLVADSDVADHVARPTAETPTAGWRWPTPDRLAPRVLFDGSRRRRQR